MSCDIKSVFDLKTASCCYVNICNTIILLLQVYNTIVHSAEIMPYVKLCCTCINLSVTLPANTATGICCFRFPFCPPTLLDLPQVMPGRLCIVKASTCVIAPLRQRLRAASLYIPLFISVNISGYCLGFFMPLTAV